MPYRLTSRVVLFLAILLLLTPGMVLAKGLGKEELSNSRKEKIAALAKDVRDHPEDGDIAFSRSSALIEENHVQAYDALKGLYRDGSEKVKAKIIKAMGVQREKVVDAATDYWVVLEQALGSGGKEVSAEVVTSLARLESEEIFDRLIEKLKTKEIQAAMLDNIVEELSRFETGQSVTKTLGMRVDAMTALTQPEHRRRQRPIEPGIARRQQVERSTRRLTPRVSQSVLLRWAAAPRVAAPSPPCRGLAAPHRPVRTSGTRIRTCDSKSADHDPETRHPEKAERIAR